MIVRLAILILLPLLLALAPDTLAHLYGRMHRGESLALYIPSLVIGLYLTVAGFAVPSRS